MNNGHRPGTVEPYDRRVHMSAFERLRYPSTRPLCRREILGEKLGEFSCEIQGQLLIHVCVYVTGWPHRRNLGVFCQNTSNYYFAKSNRAVKMEFAMSSG